MHESPIVSEHLSHMCATKRIEREVNNLQPFVLSKCTEENLGTFWREVVPPKEKDWEVVVVSDKPG